MRLAEAGERCLLYGSKGEAGHLVEKKRPTRSWGILIGFLAAQ